ncbi:MAG: hypothetical protein ACXVCY_03015 [Pseudobdellovibrionaceae bacterium]
MKNRINSRNQILDLKTISNTAKLILWFFVLQIVALNKAIAEFSPVRSPEAIHFHHLPVESIQETDVKIIFGLCPDIISSQTTDCFDPILDPAHPIFHHAKTWIDYLDGVLRARFPEKMAHVPRPYLFLNPSRDFNAAALGTERCYKISVKPNFVSSPQDQSEANGRSWQIQAPGFLAFDKKLDLITCEPLNSVEKEQELQRQLDFFNMGSRSGCQLRLQNKEVFYSQECLKNASLTTAFESSLFRISVSGDVFKINLGAYSNSVSEESFVAVLAHELGHYYRQHGDALLPQIAYYYSGKDDRSDGRRPTPRPEFNKLASQFYRFESYPINVQALAGQKLHPLLYSFFQLASPQNCKEKNKKCMQLCRQSADYVLEKLPEEDVSDYPRSMNNLPQNFPHTLLTAEKLVLACANEIKTDAEMMRVIDLDMSSADAYWYSENGFQKLRPETLADWYLEMTSSLNKLDQEWTKIFSSSMDIQLGFYTEEQEADEFATYLLSFAGLNPHLAGQIFLDQFDFSKNLGRMELDLKSCLANQKRHWPNWIPVGSMTEHHHSPCFRTYNVDTLIQREKLTPDRKVRPPIVSKEAWTELQNIAKKQEK